MRKYFLLPLIFLLAGSASYGQISGDTISKAAFDSIVKRAFTKLVTGQTEAPNLANYASFNPVEGKFTFNGYKNFSNRFATSLAATGGVLDGNIGSLFSDGKVNSNTDISLKFHFRLDKPVIFMDLKDVTSLQEKRRKIIDEQRLAIRRANQNLNNLDFELSRDSFLRGEVTKKNDTLNTEINRLNAEKQACLYSNDTSCALKKLDSLKTFQATIAKNETQIDSINYQLDSLYIIKRLDSIVINGTATFRPDQLMLFQRYPLTRSLRHTQDSLITKSYTDKIVELEKAIRIPAWNMEWLTITTNWNNKTYRTFKAIQPFADQIKKERFDAFNFGIEYNRFHFDEDFKEMRFFNIGITRKKNNNLLDLTSKKLTDEDSFLFNNTLRKLNTSYDVYTDSIEQFKLFNFYYNQYLMFGKGISSGVHFFSDIEFRETNKNIWNAGVGFIYGFNNKADGRILNTELFLKLEDITSSLDTKRTKLWDHAQIGVSISFPFVLLNNKK